MTETGQPDEIIRLSPEERVRKLTRDKSYLQLVIRLMGRVGSTTRLDDTFEALLRNILDVIGGTNISLYYLVDQQLQVADVYGRRENLVTPDDPLVQQVFTSGEPLERESAFADSAMQTPEFGNAYSWFYPLKTGAEVIGVFKMENLNLAMRELAGHLPLFFNYASLVIRNEIHNQSRLQQAYDQLAATNRVLSRQETFTRTLLENLPDGVVACDGNGTLSLFNRTAREWHGLDPLAIPPEQWAAYYDLYGPDGVTPLTVENVPLARAFRGETVRDAEMSIVAKGREPRFILTNAAPFTDGEGNRLGAVAVMLDISGRKAAENSLRQAKGELETKVLLRTAELRQANEHLQLELEQRARVEKALQLTQFAMDSTADLVFWLRPDGAFFYANKAAAKLLGYSAAELLKMKVSDINPEHRGEAWQNHWRELQEQRFLRFESALTRKDGTPVPVEITANYVEFDDQAYNCAFIRDISERVQARVFAEMGRDILHVLNEPGDLLPAMRQIITILQKGTGFEAVGIRLQQGDDFPYFAQDGFPEDFLRTENTLIARDAAGGICRDTAGKVCLECTCGQVIANKTDPTSPYCTPRGSCWTNDKADSPFIDTRLHPRNRCLHEGFQSVALVPIRTTEKIVGLIQLNDRRKGRLSLAKVELLEGLASHLSSALLRKQAEEARRNSEERYRSLFEGVPDAILIADLETGIICDANPSAAKMLGRSREELIGIHQSGLHPATMAEHTQASFQKHAQEARSGNKSGPFEHLVLRADGKEVPVEIMTQPFMMGGKQMLQGVFRDITERKLSEDKLAHEATLNSALSELTQKILMAESIEEMAVETLKKAQQLTESRFGYVGYIDTMTGFLVCPTMTHDIWDQCGVPGKNIVFEKHAGLWGWVLSKKKPLMTNNLAADSRSTGVPPGHLPITRFLSVPAFHGDILVGQIALANAGRDYQEEDLAVVERMATILALGIRRKRAEAELLKMNDDLEQRVIQRTAALEGKTADLERMNKLFVGRELRMVELKEKIRQLEQKS